MDSTLNSARLLGVLTIFLATVYLGGCGFGGASLRSPSEFSGVPQPPPARNYAPSVHRPSPAAAANQIPTAHKMISSAPSERTEEASQPSKAEVTSTLDDANRREAEKAIDQADQRLAMAQIADPESGSSDRIDLVRSLVSSARQAYRQQDYLTARSLAHKASVLAAHLPPANGTR